jgi:hypothetical protein
MSQNEKSEGSFKIKKPVKMQQKGVAQIAKVDLTKKEEDAVQEQSTNESLLQPEQPELGLQEVEQGNQEQIEITADVKENEEVIVNEEDLDLEASKQPKPELKVPENNTPEGLDKLVKFMQETGGTMEDYVRLNADYSNVGGDVLLTEYYKRTKPHLDSEEIQFLIEETFGFDEDIDDDRDIKKKKLAFKDEITKAKKFLEDLKTEYYSEIKAKSTVDPEYQKALDFFNRYKQDQQTVEQKHLGFKENTKKLFSQDFKGFDFNAGGKSFKVNISNKDVVADKQSDLNNLIKKFLNENGEVTDIVGYHKAIYAAENVDTLINQFYEQGKADAIKEMVAKSNNIQDEPRRAAPSDAFVNGFKVRAVNGVDSSKLRIKKSI